MGARISSNIDSICNRWKQRERQLSPILAEATLEAGTTVYAESRKNMKEMIYDKPIPTKGEEQEGRMAGQQAKGKVVGFGGKGMGFGTKGSRFGAQSGGGMAYKKGLTGGRGKKAWKRTGNLRRSERFRQISPYLLIISNDAGYAAARHYMKNTRYPAPWRTTAVDSNRERVRLIYRTAFRRAMQAGILPRTM